MTAWTGFFGKMPATGDFVARGLPQGLRRPLDHWLVTHVLDAGTDWPASGLRGLVGIGDHRVAFVALPSCDRLGRLYPLVALTDGARTTRAAADHWCDTVLPDLTAAQSGDSDAGSLAACLTHVAPPDARAADADAIWVAGHPARTPSAEAVRDLLSSY